jgi:hypothetical protein
MITPKEMRTVLNEKYDKLIDFITTYAELEHNTRPVISKDGGFSQIKYRVNSDNEFYIWTLQYHIKDGLISYKYKFMNEEYPFTMEELKWLDENGFELEDRYSSTVNQELEDWF